MRKKITLCCTECLSRNYEMTKNPALTERFEIMKHCPTCRKHTLHKETR